jgi:ERCC4-type nuclease
MSPAVQATGIAAEFVLLLLFCLLQVGDYVLSPEVVVERKALPDSCQHCI